MENVTGEELPSDTRESDSCIQVNELMLKIIIIIIITGHGLNRYVKKLRDTIRKTRRDALERREIDQPSTF